MFDAIIPDHQYDLPKPVYASEKSGSSSMGSTFLNSEKSTRVIAEMLAGQRSVRSAILAAAPGYLVTKLRRA